jgi:DNA-binding NarL/FixJ family response regulator
VTRASENPWRQVGRKPKLTAHQQREAIQRRDADGESVREIARSYNVSHSTVLRLTAGIFCPHAPNNGAPGKVFRSARRT